MKVKSVLVAPSILSADFRKLEDEVKKVERSGADLVHVDVMDGCFVPNITVGPLVVKAVRKCTRLPIDVHLMIEGPHRFIEDFVEAGSDIVTIHVEAYPRVSSNRYQATKKGTSKSVDKIDEDRVREVLSQIKGYGKKAGLSLNPDSPLCIQGVLGDVDMVLIMSVHPGFGGQGFIDKVIPKIKELKKIYDADIEVDGGINDENIKLVLEAGANVIVAGSYFFSAKDPIEAIKKLRGQ